MAKCDKCGRKGLFLRLSRYGLCNECQALEDREDELKALEKRNSEIIAAHERALDEIKQRTEKIKAEAAAAEKIEAKTEAIHKKYLKAERDYDSIMYVIENFYAARDLSEVGHFELGIDTSEIKPDLKCMSVKELRSQYRQNERAIKELLAKHQNLYTAKSNMMIYKLMVMALEAELRNILSVLKFGKLEDGIDKVKAVTAKYYEIVASGNLLIAPTVRKFIGQLEYYYIEAVKIEYEYYAQQERIREEQRALREQMRQEAEEKKLLDQQRKQVEKEEKKYVQEIDRIKDQLSASDAEDSPEVRKLREQLAKLQSQLADVETKKADIINLQNGKAGTVYVISNIGSFGEHVFKVGMTRRLEPQDRINELSNASVPFPFDVHCFIFSQDAVALEGRLHKELNSRRVNKVNLRKEFFDISIDELHEMVERVDPTAAFTETALAEQYRQSLSMGDDVVFEMHLDESDEDEIA